MKTLLILLLFVFTISEVHAQYGRYKNKYEVKDYKYERTDHYNPAAATVLAIIPGFGHFYVGEPLRGLGFVGLMYGSVLVTTVGVSQAYNHGNRTSTSWLILGGAFGVLGSYIWSIADVSRVVKIKNLHFRDQDISFHLQPSVQPFAIEHAATTNIKGVSLRLNF
jgi:hypothetical protein